MSTVWDPWQWLRTGATCVAFVAAEQRGGGPENGFVAQRKVVLITQLLTLRCPAGPTAPQRQIFNFTKVM